MRRILSRLDTESYTAELERLLRERDVDVDKLQSKYEFKRVSLAWEDKK